LEQDHSKFSQAVVPALVAIIDADATRAMAADAERLYPLYVWQVATVLGRTTDASLRTAVTPALAKLAAKSPVLQSDVTAYAEATSDLIRWRRITAKALARKKRQDTPAIETIFASAAVPTDGAAAWTAGVLSAPAPNLVPTISKLVGQEVLISDVLNTPAGRAASPYRSRMFASMPSVSDTLKRYLPTLEYDLLIAQNAPALSLEAAEVLYNAAEGNLAAAGGKVENATLLGFVPHFAAMPPACQGSVRFTGLQDEKQPDVPARQVLIQYELKPTWLHFDLFYIPMQ